jgi:hypothetical protein
MKSRCNLGKFGAFCVTGLVAAWACSPFANAKPKDRALIGTIVEWRYPDAAINGDGRTRVKDGATLRGGVRTTVSDRMETILTTPDSFEKVVTFYTHKFGISEDESQRVDGPEGGQSVFAQDDSQDRPVKLRVLSVNRDDTATTLVISRAKDEPLTHIAWSQYHWLSREELQRLKDQPDSDEN